MWKGRNFESRSQAPVIEYKTAEYLYDKEKISSLVSPFSLPAEWLHKRKEELIFHVTHWDVLRPEANQQSSKALTLTTAQKMKVSQIRTIYMNTFKLKREPKLTKDKMLVEMFPDEAALDPKLNILISTPQQRQPQRQQRLQELHLLREEV